MPLKYQNEERLKSMQAATGVTTTRLSELRRIAYGGRGGHYDETMFLRALSFASAATTAVDLNLPDARLSYVSLTSAAVAGSNRFDQLQRVHFERGSAI